MPQPLTNETLTGEPLAQWVVKEYDQYQRSTRWYILMSLSVVFLVVFGIFTNNFLFSIIILLAVIIIFLQSHQTPPDIQFAITELGVVVHNKFYPYTELEQFYIVYQPPEVKTLFIQNKSMLRPTLRIPLMDQNPVEVRSALREFLAEDPEHEEEPMSDTVARRWKIQ